jgi:hypothetical protein
VDAVNHPTHIISTHHLFNQPSLVGMSLPWPLLEIAIQLVFESICDAFAVVLELSGVVSYVVLV